MLELNALVILYVIGTSCFIMVSKDKNNRSRPFYLFVNGCIILWESFPYFMSISEPSLEVLYQWTPLILLPLLHRETALITKALGKPALDPSFIHFEKKYFPAVMNIHHQNRANYKWLSEFLHFCYLSHFFLIYGVPLYFYLKHEMLPFYIATFSILFVMFACFLTHGFMPVFGPRNIFEKMKDSRSHGFFFKVVHVILEAGSTDGTAFPSGHTAVAFVIILITYYLNTPLFYFLFPICIGLIVSTVYGRFHYVMDVFFGIIYAMIAFVVTVFLFHHSFGVSYD